MVRQKGMRNKSKHKVEHPYQLKSVAKPRVRLVAIKQECERKASMIIKSLVPTISI
jgi:hypothetical protein